MNLGGSGPLTVGLCWFLTLLPAVWVGLRTYTRKRVVNSYGLDDHVYVAALVLLVVSTSLVTVSAYDGLGRRIDEIDNIQSVIDAAFYGIMSQTFAATSLLVAKWSLGLFLLRIVEQKQYKWIIWFVLICFTFITLIWCILFWVQCEPFEYLYDRTIPGGECVIPFLPVSIIHACIAVLTDWIFAVLPWFFLAKLQMNRREKFITVSSLSLGIFAGVFGIVRATRIPALFTDNYLRDGVGIIIWTAAEVCVTMVCIGIPVCRPLYKKWYEYFRPGGSMPIKGHEKAGYRKHDSYLNKTDSRQGTGLVPLRTIGGSALSPMDGRYGFPGTTTPMKGKDIDDSPEPARGSPGNPFSGGFSRAYAQAGRLVRGQGRQERANSSDEETLAGDIADAREGGAGASSSAGFYRDPERGGPSRQGRNRPSNPENQIPRGLGLLMGITVTEEFVVTSNKEDI